MDSTQERTPSSLENSRAPATDAAFHHKFIRRYYEKFLGDTIPAFENKTPRQAANNPRLRPKLIELLKGHINIIDERNLETGMSLSIDWILDELNLPELR